MKDLSLTKLHFKVFSCFVLLSVLLILAQGCGSKKSESTEAENDIDSLDADFDADFDKVVEDADETEDEKDWDSDKTEDEENWDSDDTDDSETVSEPDNSDTESDNDQDFTDYDDAEPFIDPCLEEPCKSVENSTGECLTKGMTGDYVCLCKENFVWFPNKKTCEPVSSFKGLSCTGQIKCYDNEKEIPCPKAGEPFSGQDANYAENRSCLPQNFTIKNYGSDKTVIDNNSKLEWVQEVRVSYYPSNYPNTISVGGYSDWRKTTFKDYKSIIDSGTFDPVINEAYFPDTPSGIFVMGMLEYLHHTGPQQGYAYYIMGGIDFQTGLATARCSDQHTEIGDIPGNMPKELNYRSVRDLPDKQESCTVTLQTGEYELLNLLPQKLLLLKTPEKDKNWQEALEYCENLSYAGISEWRLPNRNETYFIHDHDTEYPYSFWSSTSYTNDPTQAIVYTTIFCTGVCCTQFYSTTAQNKTNKAHTACVAFDPCPEGEMWTGEKCTSFDELGLKSNGGGLKEKGSEWEDPNFECSLQIL
ncbi:DUF1566 domain-containing protein [bacterium]|nr:DUF1566 domain-containing protein [bacterium]